MARQRAAADSPRRKDQELAGEDSELQKLDREYDKMLAYMQTTEAASAVDALFEMDTDELGAAATRATRARDQ